MTHIVLLGDSIFDNAAYVPGEPPLIEQLNTLLNGNAYATLLAVDGDITDDVAGQARDIPRDATHLVVSVGGNDALQVVSMLHGDQSAQELLTGLTAVQDNFKSSYREMLDGLLEWHLPATVCTVYDAVPNLHVLAHDSAATALSLFNDVIVREAASRGLPVIDLRTICDSTEDYSEVSPIEPSAIGAEKIARAIHHVYSQHEFEKSKTIVFA